MLSLGKKERKRNGGRRPKMADGVLFLMPFAVRCGVFRSKKIEEQLPVRKGKNKKSVL